MLISIPRESVVSEMSVILKTCQNLSRQVVNKTIFISKDAELSTEIEAQSLYELIRTPLSSRQRKFLTFTFVCQRAIFMVNKQSSSRLLSQPRSFRFNFPKPISRENKASTISRDPNQPNNAFLGFQLPFRYIYSYVYRCERDGCMSNIDPSRSLPFAPKAIRSVMSHAVLLIFECGLFGLL